MSKQRFFPVRLNPDDPYDVTLYPVTEEEYFALYRPVWRKRKEMQKARQCRCPKKMLWACDGECDLCRYQVVGREISYDRFVDDYGDHLVALGTDPAEIAADQEIMRLLLKQLGELCPDAIDVGSLVAEGMSQREALNQLGLKRSTYRSQVQKVEKMLRKEFSIDDIEEIFSRK